MIKELLRVALQDRVCIYGKNTKREYIIKQYSSSEKLLKKLLSQCILFYIQANVKNLPKLPFRIIWIMGEVENRAQDRHHY